MNLQEQLHLIARLKRYPKHGQATDPLKQVQQGLKQVFDLYKVGGDEIIRLNVFGQLSDQISGVVNNLSVLQRLNEDVSKGFGVNTDEAAKLGIQIEAIAKKSGLNSQKQKQFVVELTKLFGASSTIFNQSNKYGNTLIKQNDALRNQLQISEEAARNFVGYQSQALVYQNKQFEASRESFADVAAQFEQLGYKGAFRDILEGFSELDARQRATFGRMPEQLGLALFKSKQLGVSLNSITSGAEGFLDVESAISKELEFQILSGQELTTANGESLTAAMQQAVIQQDANKQVELFAGFIEKYGDQLRDNIFLQKTAADIFSLQSDEIFRGLEGTAAQNMSLESLNKTAKDFYTTTVDGQTREINNYNELIKQGDIRTEQEKQIDRNVTAYISSLGDYSGEVERLNAGFAATSDILLSGAGGMANQAIQKGQGLISTAVGAMNVGTIIVDTLKFATDISNLTSAKQSQNLPLGTLQQSDDLFIPATSGNIISGPLGSFALNPKDDILAAPNIRNTVNGDSSGVASAVVSALKGMSFHVTNVFDGQKVKSSLTILDQSTLNNTNII